MKKSIVSLVIANALLALPAQADVTKEQLGQMLLGKTSVVITQNYLDYYAEGLTGPTTKGGYHPGIDYRSQQPETVYAPLDGVVDAVPGGPYGILAIKKDGSETRIILAHMSAFSVKKGDKVQTGCAIGKTGRVGTDAPHLHVEARVGRNTAAYYFQTKTDTGVNKPPETIPPSYKLLAPFACRQ